MEKTDISRSVSSSLYHNTGLAAIALAAILWSTGGLFIKWINLPAISILTFRAFFASLLFLSFLDVKFWFLHLKYFWFLVFMLF